MKNGSKSALLVWAALMQIGAASAAEARLDGPRAAAVADASLRVTLENKMRLVKLLLAQSPAVQRIPQSNHAPAKKKLAEAQALYAEAQVESDAGRAEAAILLLDESLRHIVSASALVPDIAQQAAQERSRNMRLREAIRSFQTRHKNMSSRMPAREVQTAAADIERIDAMVEQADALVASGSQHEANLLLNSAYKIVVATLNRILTTETIVYDLKFDSSAEEFRYELARNLSYEELIPIALAQLNTARETATLAERYVQQSRDLREAAQKHAGGGDYNAAVKTIQDATSHLQRSLRIAGVIVPQSSEIKP